MLDLYFQVSFTSKTLTSLTILSSSWFPSRLLFLLMLDFQICFTKLNVALSFCSLDLLVSTSLIINANSRYSSLLVIFYWIPVFLFSKTIIVSSLSLVAVWNLTCCSLVWHMTLYLPYYGFTPLFIMHISLFLYNCCIIIPYWWQAISRAHCPRKLNYLSLYYYDNSLMA